MLIMSSKNHHKFQLLSIVHLGAFGEGSRGCLRTTSVVTRTDALRTWMRWGAEVLGYDRLECLTTTVTRKVVSLN
ncbi:hypothetical protein A2U01_0000849 [Trifolium medium]|uniref:Uncharacterized protein n=1 Tax=Trifolium medium TaxID=97028 RepID=A0A392LYN4_9FABA|nr:hypothetical protein [Trifolium medium]